MGDEIRITVIAAGFDSGQPPRKQPGISARPGLKNRSTGQQSRPSSGSGTTAIARPVPQHAEEQDSHSAQEGSNTQRSTPPVAEDDLDIPDFMK